MITSATAGPYLRVAEPDWDDPLDPGYALVVGGRWNAPGSYPVLYLTATLGAARANADLKFSEQLALGISLDLLDPSVLPDLIEVEVPAGTALDLISDDGLRAVGLPVTYPLAAGGQRVSHHHCQPVGAQAHARDLDGVLARCAAEGARSDDTELAWFPRQGGGAPTTGSRRPFHDWYEH